MAEYRKLQIGTEFIPSNKYNGHPPISNIATLNPLLKKIYRQDRKRAYVVHNFFEDIRKNMKASAPVEENLFEFDDAKLTKHYITKLPASLHEAMMEIEKGRIVRETFGEYTWKRYLEAKKEEWDTFRIWVTDWETKRYLPNM